MVATATLSPRLRRKHLLYLLSLAIVAVVLLSSVSPAYASTAVDATSTSNPLGWSNQRRTFRNPRGTNAYYVFYADSASPTANRVAYAYSTDGLTWTTDQIAFSTSAAITSASVTYIQDAANSRLLVYECGDLGTVAVSAANDLIFRAGYIDDASSAITWFFNDAVAGAGSTTLGFVACSIGVDNNGRIGIAYDRLATGITHTAAVLLSNTAKPTAAPTWNSQTGLSDTSANTSTLSVFASITPATGDSKALANSHQFAVVSMNTNTLKVSAIHIDWTGSAATKSTLTTSAALASPSSMSCVSVSSGNVVCGYGSNSLLKSRTVTIGSGTTAPSLGTQATAGGTDAPEANLGVSLSYQGGSVDDLWIFWAVGTTVNVKAAYSDAATATQTWSSATTLETESTIAHGPRSAPEAFSSAQIPYALYDAATNIRWNSLVQVTVTSSPTGSDFVTVDSTPYATPTAFNWTQGSTHALAASSSVSCGASCQYVWSSWSDSGAQSHTATTSPSTLTYTASFQKQWQVTFTSGGIGADTSTNTVVTVGGVNYAQGSLPYTAWYNDGSSVTYTFASTVASTTTGKQYAWSSTSGLSQTLRTNTFAITNTGTVTGTFTPQWQVTFTSSGIGSDTNTNTIVTVGGVNYAQGSLPYTAWYNDGASVTYTFQISVSATAGKQYAWSSTSGLSQTLRTNTFTVSGTGTVTGTYVTQYQLTITLNGHGVSSPTSGNWYNSGTVVSVSISSDGSSNSTTIRYLYNGATGTGSGSFTGSAQSFSVTMNAAITESIAWTTQYYLTVTSAHDSPTPTSGWYDSGASVTASVTSPADESGGTRYASTGWTGTGSVVSGSGTSTTFSITAPSSITWNWMTQYQLTVQTSGLSSLSYPTNIKLDVVQVGTAYDSSAFTKWFDTGTGTGTIGVDATVNGATGTRYDFTKWSDDSTANPRASVTMDEPQTFTAIYEMRYDAYILTVNIDGSGSVARLPDQASYHYGDSVQLTANPAAGWSFSAWSGDISGSVNPKSIIINGTTSVTATFTQNAYILTVNIDGSGSVARLPDQASYHYGDSVQLTANPAAGWSFSAWSGDISGSVNPKSIIINGTTSVTATFTQSILHHFDFDPISSPQTAGSAFAITITAKDQHENIVTSYTGSNTLSDSTGTISPTSTGAFSAGVWTGSVTITKAQTGVTITTTGDSKTGTSNNFNVNPTSSSVQSATGTGSVVFSPDAGVIEGLTAVSESTLPSAGKPSLTFPHGFFTFRITGLGVGQTVTVTVTLPSDLPTTASYWKYHASEGGWIQIPIGSNDGDNVITITLVDGGLGDDDGIANGVIVDQGGPGTSRAAAPVGGVLMAVNKLAVLVPYLALVGLIAAASSLYALRRRCRS